MFQNELNPYMKYHPSVVIHLLVSWQAFVGPQLDSLSAVVWRSFWEEITRPFRWPLSSPKMLQGTVALSLPFPVQSGPASTLRFPGFHLLQIN